MKGRSSVALIALLLMATLVPMALPQAASGPEGDQGGDTGPRSFFEWWNDGWHYRVQVMVELPTVTATPVPQWDSWPVRARLELTELVPDQEIDLGSIRVVEYNTDGSIKDQGKGDGIMSQLEVQDIYQPVPKKIGIVHWLLSGMNSPGDMRIYFIYLDTTSAPAKPIPYYNSDLQADMRKGIIENEDLYVQWDMARGDTLELRHKTGLNMNLAQKYVEIRGLDIGYMDGSGYKGLADNALGVHHYEGPIGDVMRGLHFEGIIYGQVDMDFVRDVYFYAGQPWIRVEDKAMPIDDGHLMESDMDFGSMFRKPFSEQVYIRTDTYKGDFKVDQFLADGDGQNDTYEYNNFTVGWIDSYNGKDEGIALVSITQEGGHDHLEHNSGNPSALDIVMGWDTPRNVSSGDVYRQEYYVLLHTGPALQDVDRFYGEISDQPKTKVGGIEDLSYGIELSCTDNVRLVEPGETTVYNITVQNTGTGTDVIFLTQDLGVELGDEEDWVSFLSHSSVTLQSGASVGISLTVTAPLEGIGEDMATVKVTGTSQADPKKKDSVFTFTTLNITFDMDLEVDRSIKRTLGEVVAFDLLLSNLGNGKDIYDIRATSPPQGWTGTLGLTEAMLAPGGSAVFNYTLGPPGGASRNDSATVTITATSKNDPSHGEASVHVTLVVDPFHFLHLDVDGTPKHGDPGDDVVFNITLTNLGNGPDVFNISFGMEGAGGWNMSLAEGGSGGATPGLILLDSNGTELMVLEVSIPTDARFNDSREVWVRAVSEGNTSMADSVTARTVVDQVFDMQVDVLEDELSRAQGKSGTYSFTVENRGNGPITVNVRVTDAMNGWLGKPSMTVLQIGAGVIDTVLIPVKVPKDAVPGDHTGLVSVSEPHEDRVTIGLTMHVHHGSNMTLSLGPKFIQIPAGTWREVTLHLRNDGNGPELLDLSLEGNASLWANLTITNLTLDKGSNFSEPIRVLVPLNATAGQYNLTVTTWDATGNLHMATTIITVKKEKVPTSTGWEPCFSLGPAMGLALLLYLTVHFGRRALDRTEDGGKGGGPKDGDVYLREIGAKAPKARTGAEGKRTRSGPGLRKGKARSGR